MANALPTLKDRADFITERPRGDGVIELIDQLLANNFFQPGTAQPSKVSSTANEDPLRG